jgi:chromosomal replication initiation ATPase DnaA
MTPSVLAAHERSKRFHAHIAKKAAELKRLKIAAIEQPLVVASVSKSKPTEADKAPLSWKILRAVAQEFDVTVSEMRCTSQHYRYVLPRQIAVGLMVEMTNLSWLKIGALLGGRDHSTALHSWRRYQVISSEESVRNRLDQIKAVITHG